MSAVVETIHSGILARLAAVRRKQNIRRATGGIVLACAVFGSLLLAALLLEDVFYFGTSVRTAAFWILLGLLCGLLVWKVAIPLLRLFGVIPDETDRETAGTIGRSFPGIGDRLVNILQLHRELEGSTLYSTELIEAAFSDIDRQIEGVDFTSVVAHPVSRRMKRAVAAVGLAAVLFLIVSPASFLGSAYRLWNYGQVFAAPMPFSLRVEPGDREIIRGEDVSVAVHVDGPAPRHVVLTSRHEGETTPEEVELSAGSDGVFRHELNGVRLTTLYSAVSGPVRSTEYKLTVVDRPVVTRLRVALQPPSYTGLPAQQLDDNVGDLTALAGTRASFTLETSRELAEASLLFDDSTALLLETRGSSATGSFVLRRNCRYHIRLRDLQGTPNADPVEYTVRILPDAPPTVAIVVPGTNLDVTDNTSLNLVIKIADDYGFSRLRLAYRLVQSKYEQPPDHVTYVDIPLPHNPGLESMVPYTWNLTSLRLVPEDVVSYYAEVFDNDRITGPKSAVSETFTLRLPSLEEVFQDVDQRHETSLDDIKNALTKAEDAHKEMEDLRQQLRKEQQKLNWEDQKKAESVLKKYEEIQKAVQDVNTTVHQMLDEMEKNKVLSQETLEKYQELQQLMEQLNSPELSEALKKLQQSMQQLSPEALKQALEQFNFSEENFRKGLERTINLLKRLKIEAKLDELTRRTEALQKEQDDIRERTERANPDDRQAMKDLQQRQEGAQQELDQLKKEMQDLEKSMAEFPKEMPVRDMQALQDSLTAGGLQQDMQDIQQDLRQGSMQSAAQGQRQAAGKMGAMAQQMRQIKQAMLANQQQQIVNEMRRVTQDLLELSRREEDLKNESQSLEPNSSEFRQNARRQMDVLRDLGTVTEKMTALSQKSFGVSPEMGKSIGDALQQMDGAMQSLEQRNGSAATQQQGSAMGSLNEAAQLMEQAMSTMMQSGGQGMMGMSGFMMRLQQMSEQQRSINEGTRNLGSLTPEQAAQLGRLAGEQGMVRKSLEQLQREAAASGQLSRMLGDLGSIAQEMREVQSDLAQGNVNPETLRRQDRILSRLLDSQRSTRERDYENRRRAESGKTHPGTPPGPLDLSSQEGRNRLREDLLRALQEGYARDYEDLIRKYFEALEQQQNAEEH